MQAPETIDSPPEASDSGLATAAEGLVVVVVGGGAMAAATTTSYGVPLIAATGAVIVAIIGARTASRRQDRQIAAEGRRHDASLAAERERQGAQLEHERHAAAVADLRSMLDEASHCLRLADNLVAHAATLIRMGDDVRQEAFAIGEELDDVAGRLCVRVGAVDPLYIAFGEPHSAFRELIAGTDQTFSAERVKRITVAFARGMEHFYEVASARVGLRASETDEERDGLAAARRPSRRWTAKRSAA